MCELTARYGNGMGTACYVCESAFTSYDRGPLTGDQADRLLDRTLCGPYIYDSAVTALVTSNQCDWLTKCWDSQSTVLVFHYSGMW